MEVKQNFVSVFIIFSSLLQGRFGNTSLRTWMLQLHELSSPERYILKADAKKLFALHLLHFFPIFFSYDLLLLFCLQHPWFLYGFIFSVLSCGAVACDCREERAGCVGWVLPEPLQSQHTSANQAALLKGPGETSLCCTCCLVLLVNVPIPLPFHPPLKDTAQEHWRVQGNSRSNLFWVF